MDAERPTFSPVWHRVARMTPRLRSHVQITRQQYRGRRWHVVRDPTSNNFYRLSPVAHELVCLLDGQRTVESAWGSVLQTHGDAAPTQNEVVELLGQLYSANLLRVDTTPDTEQLLRRGRDRLKKKAIGRIVGIMYFKIKLFNPDAIVSAIEPVVRPLISPTGLVLWAALVLAGLVQVASHWPSFASGVDSAIAPSNWPWLIAVFVVTKVLHELGHGVICKRFGGYVPETGVMILVLFPSPYVDASSCWAFPSKWQRIAVGAGGMIVELALAAVAAFVWTLTLRGDESVGLVNQLAYNTIFTAGISTILFNANPLMKFDGYYMLSDLLEVPNLMQRSQQMIQHLIKKHAYRLKDDRPPSVVPGERGILVVYGLLGAAYRLFLFVSITLFVMGKLFGLGLVLAVWTASAWFLIPAGKFLHWLFASQQTAEHRARAVFTSLAIGLVLLIGLGVVPAPDARLADGVVESERRSGVFFGSRDGFVVAVHVEPGQRVSEGDLLVECQSPGLTAELAHAQAALREVEAIERASRQRSAAAAEAASAKAEALRQQVQTLERLEGLLVVRAPHDGRVVGPDPGRLLGAFVRQGEPLLEVVDDQSVRVAASLTTAQAIPVLIERQRRAASGAQPGKVEVRRVANASANVSATRVEIIEGGVRELRHPALGFQGGGSIETEPGQDPARASTKAKRPQFVALLWAGPASADGQGALGAPGERVRVRFALPPKPLLWQWSNRLQQLIQGRAQI